ncbi:MAG: AAA family ATPase [Gemmatimonadetes bacterium]|nr:MAG: AAA family ATPase [Gemmatimonadota bacterium]
MTYEQFYNLTMQPFSNSPDGRFYCPTSQHQQAIIRMMYAAYAMKGLALLVGGIGCGKTTLSRRLLNELSPDEYETGLLVIVHANITAHWLLRKIASQLGVQDPKEEKIDLLNQIFHRLMEIHDEGKKAVIIIDEANMLNTRELMEEFRGLLNMELPGRKLITFILVGLPELEDHLALDEPLKQRVAVRFSLQALLPDGVKEYIQHRLSVAGGNPNTFSDEAIKLIYRTSRGVPRVINTICDNALFEGYLLQKPIIDAELIRTVCISLGLIQPEYQRKVAQLKTKVAKLKATRQHRQKATPAGSGESGARQQVRVPASNSQ